MVRSKNSPARNLMLIALMTMTSIAIADRPANPNNGTVYDGNSITEVWHAESGKWVAPETFWLDYVSQGQGKFWGRSSQYPTYNQVNEHDTLMIEVPAGSCLMYFFHGRWRRAQDVVRWDPKFNEVLGCPTVFD